ncbi:MAG: hypothetical protein ACYTGZ_15555 [Planctomycetota bacterium]|jgi:hypothetical protein
MAGSGHRRIVALLLLAFVASVADGDTDSNLDRRVGQADARFARRFASLALRADKAKQRATARRLFQRVLALDPGNRIARGKLLFKKRKGSWERPSADTAAVERWADTDQKRADELREERNKLEQLRAKELLKLAAKYGTPETAKPHLLALLDFVPRMKEVRIALGHEIVGGRYVRPEMVAFARAMPERLAAWKKCAKPVDAFDTKKTVSFPGVKEAKPLLRVGERQVSSGYTRANTVYLARRTECSHAMLRHLFGESVERWDKSPLYFLSPRQFRQFVYARHRDASTRKRKLRFSTYQTKECAIIKVNGEFRFPLDLYAHSVGFRTMENIVSPKKADGKPDDSRYPWIKEGVGLLLTLEMLNSANSWFTSTRESTGKLQPSQPLPEKKTRANCLAYVRGQLYDGALPPLREIWGNSLNNLDRNRALHAWTFIRFIALYDPAGFRKLPAELKAQTEGAQADRTARALQKAFGVDANELVRLWRIYLLDFA